MEMRWVMFSCEEANHSSPLSSLTLPASRAGLHASDLHKKLELLKGALTLSDRAYLSLKIVSVISSLLLG